MGIERKVYGVGLVCFCALTLCASVSFAQDDEVSSDDVEATTPESEGTLSGTEDQGSELSDDEVVVDDPTSVVDEPEVAPVKVSPEEASPVITQEPDVPPQPVSEEENLGQREVEPSEDVDDSSAVTRPGWGKVESQFTFGSYGRVRGATDFRGGRPEQVNVVSHGSRVDEYNYAELEFQQLFVRRSDEDSQRKAYAQVVSTLALGDNLFHYTGSFDQSIALRNLYADMGYKTNGLTLGFWGGSRMYRGDDIYLLDFWPLDNLNTVGGGGYASYDWTGVGRSEVKIHSGSSRLDDPFQLQVVQVPGFEFGTQDVVYLNRQRIISSARIQQDVWLSVREDGSPKAGVKLVAYAEDHKLPEGLRRESDGIGEERVPAEKGRKLGAELGVWKGEGFFKGSFANMFYVQANDLAAYGEFGVPTGVNLNETSEGARSRMFALSADIETPYAGLLVGSYYKYFQDADRDSEDFDDYWEAIAAARMHVYVTDMIHPGVEYSYQLRRPAGPSGVTDQYEVPVVSKFSVMQSFRLQKGMYNRPEVRILYTRSNLNASAVRLLPGEDPRLDYQDSNGALTSHYLGVMVEWWFNNASLFRP